MNAYETTIDWLQHHMLSCPSKKLFYIDCPGCGLQRSLIALLKGNISASWHIYPPGVFIVASFFVLALHLVFRFRYGGTFLKYMYIVTALIMFINYIYKIKTNQLL